MRTKKFIVALCFSFFMFMCSVSTVYAYNTYNQHKLTYGVGNYGKDTQHYFITSSASSYASYINTAMSEWVNTTSSMGVTTPISYTKTTTQSSSRMDIYQVSTVNEWWGLTTMYNGSTEVDPFSSNWAWGKIQLTTESVTIKVPVGMSKYLVTMNPETELTRNALLLYPYILNQTISHGRAAEILGIRKSELIDLYDKLGYSYFDMTMDDLDDELNTFRELKKKEAAV